MSKLGFSLPPQKERAPAIVIQASSNEDEFLEQLTQVLAVRRRASDRQRDIDIGAILDIQERVYEDGTPLVDVLKMEPSGLPEKEMFRRARQTTHKHHR